MNILCYAPTETEVRIEVEFDTFLNFYGPCISTDDNANLSVQKKGDFIVTLKASHHHVLNTRYDEGSKNEITFRKGIPVIYHH